MLLPQSEAFHTLKARLACIPSLHLHCDSRYIIFYNLIFLFNQLTVYFCKRNQTEIKAIPVRMKSIDFDALLEHFLKVQDRQKDLKRRMRSKEITTLEKDVSNLQVLS